jgi:hypothetical protein
VIIRALTPAVTITGAGVESGSVGSYTFYKFTGAGSITY